MVAVLACSSCVATETVVCDSGKICPTTYTCTADGLDCIYDTCGDGILDITEMCDDGNIRDGDSCVSDCSRITSCGNGILEPEYDEICDDDNTDDRDGCSADCLSDESCGNGILDLTVDEACDDGNRLDDDGCDANCLIETCGDGILDSDWGEICDDGNNLPGDYCSPTCRVEPMLAVGAEHSCALLDTGTVRCWGAGTFGQLGYGTSEHIGDNEPPIEAGDVAVGGTVFQITAGNSHTCALLDTGSVRCWGAGLRGRLGYGNALDIGDDETPESAGDVDIGGLAVQISAGSLHTCALLDTGAVRCWGEGDYGRLGYGNTDDIGDDELPAMAGDVDIGGSAVKIATSTHHTCAILDDGAVRCWGLGNVGRLGLANGGPPVGDNELPASTSPIDLGGPVSDIGLGVHHTCVLMQTGTVRCWGAGDLGQLGYGTRERFGDDEHPSAAGDVPLDGAAIAVAAGGNSSCALIADDQLGISIVRCWGLNDRGQLGIGSTEDIGDTELPTDVDPIDLAGTAIQVAIGQSHMCALLDTYDVRCWGLNGQGRLGNNLGNIGDDELPSSVPIVEYR